MSARAGAAHLAGVRGLALWQPLRVPDFRRLWGSEAVSLVGDQFHYIALSWLVLQLTGSGLALGAVLIASGVPRAAMLVPFGALADRASPRVLVAGAHLARGVIVAGMAAVVLGGPPSLPLLVALTVAFGVADALFLPAQSAWVPRLVDADRLPAANAMLQGTMQLTSLLGPPIAGVVVAAVGSGVAFALDAASFVVAAAIVLRIGRGAVGALVRTAGTPSAPSAASAPPAEDAPAGPSPSFRGEVVEGVRYALGDPAIRTLLVVILAINVAFNGPVAVGLPWLADRRFDAGAAGLGVLVAAWGAGALVGTVVAGSLRVARIGWLVTGLVGVAAACLAGIGVAPAVVPAMAMLAIMGVAVGIVNILVISWLQARIDPTLLGRVMSLTLLMSFGASPLSLGLAGFLVDTDATLMFVLAAALVAATLALGIAMRLPALLDERGMAGGVAPSPGAEPVQPRVADAAP